MVGNLTTIFIMASPNNANPDPHTMSSPNIPKPDPHTMASPNNANLEHTPHSKLKHFTINILTPALLWLTLWHFAAYKVGQELLLPSPTTVAQTLAQLIVTPDFWKNLLSSTRRVTSGIFLGTLLGGLLALLTYFSKTAHTLLSPLIKIIQATPVVSFILLVLLWTKRDHVPIVASILMVLPLIWSTTQKGLAQTDPHLLELGKSYHFSPLKTCHLIYLPSTLPYFLSSLSNSISLGWKSGIAAEVIAQPPKAIGTEMNLSKLYLDTPTLFAWTTIIILLSAIMEKILHTLFPHQKSQEVSP